MTREEREDAINYFKNKLENEVYGAKYNKLAIEALEQEPRTGHWIPTYGNVKCSECGSVKGIREVGKATHYCDFCGAKMVES